MSITVTGKLNDTAKIFMQDNGDAVFGVRIGKKEYDRKKEGSDKTVWANYSGGIYARANQVDYHKKMLVEGSVVSLSGSGIIPREWTGEQSSGVDLNLVDAKLEYAFSPDAPANPGAAAGMAQKVAASPSGSMQAPSAAAANFDSFDDDISF